MKDVRPTSGRVLLALFSILGPMENRSFLDLFAGTGRVGLEALERGASNVVWVESVRSRARDIERCVSGNHASSACTVLSLELRRAVSWLTKRGMKFDVIFADPPYNDGWGAALMNVKGLTELISDGGTLAVEHSSREALEVPGEWALSSRREYGETVISFLTLADIDRHSRF